MEERFKYIHFKSEFFYNLLILNPSNYIKLIKIQITVNVSSKRRLGQDQQNIKVVWNNLQTASKRKLDSFGTADIPISTPIPTTTSPWYRFAIGQPKTEMASNKPTTSTAIKSAFRVRWLIAKANWFDSGIITAGANWRTKPTHPELLTNPSNCKTSIAIARRGWITTYSGIMHLIRVGLWIRIRLGYLEMSIFIHPLQMLWFGLIY